MNRRFYETRIANLTVIALLEGFDVLVLMFTDRHCNQVDEHIILGHNVTETEWRDLVDSQGIRPDGIEAMLDGLTAEDIFPSITLEPAS